MNFCEYFRFLKRNQIPFVYYRYGNMVKVLSNITEMDFAMSLYEWTYNHFLIGEPVPQEREVVFEDKDWTWMYDSESDHN